jgi:hypothetical protein
MSPWIQNCAADLKLQWICKAFLLKASGQRHRQMPRDGFFTQLIAGAVQQNYVLECRRAKW